MNTNTDKSPLLNQYYETHHKTGKRLSQSFLEQERGALFSSWIGKDKTVLDLGGRDGTLTRLFIDGNRVTIGDIDQNALASAKQQYPVDTMITNLNERLSFDGETFDVVVMAEVLEHLPYPRITLNEIRRILKKTGQFIGNIPLAYHLKDRYQILRGKKLVISGDPTHLQFFSYDDLVKLLSGFMALKNIEILKGGNKTKRFSKLFARNVAFRCIK